MNTWSFIDGDIVLSSEDEEQMQMANAWIANLVQAIKSQVLEEVANGRTKLSNDSGSEQPELPEVPC